ncbi:hypothetical protein EDB87DRAFT_1688303 [Lactarius vividus]|nr:hypothetical protein EDB87DRAFT_1688303 [Lactarius vividus]
MLSSSDRIEPEHQIEQCDLAVCAISEQGELRPREAPIVVDNLTGGHTVFVTFVALVEEVEFRLFVRNNGRFDSSADIFIRGESLGKWLIAREPKAWHNIGCDSLFKFQDSYDRRSKSFEPSTIELRFQYLSRVEEGRDKDGFVPVTVREPTPDDGPSCVPLSNALMQSQFETMEDQPFLTFVIAFYPPPTTFPTVPPPAYPEPVPGSISSSEGGSTTSSDSIFQMSDDDLEDALSEHKKSRLLLPARLTPGFGGKLPMEDFCRRYELPEDIPSVLAQLRVKDAHALSKVYLRELRDKGMALRSINMLQLAVIRFSSESRP